MAAKPPFYHDKQYQCWCGVNAERAAYVIAVLGIVWSCLTLSVLNLVAYVCVIMAIRTRNPIGYKVFAFIASSVIGMYIGAIMLLVAWIAVADVGGATWTFGVIGLLLVIVALLVQFWVCWVVRRAYAYTTAARDYERANGHTHPYNYPYSALCPSAYPPYGAPQSPPLSTADTAYPHQAVYPQQQPQHPENV